MKKTLNIFIVLFVLFSILNCSACGGSEEEPTPEQNIEETPLPPKTPVHIHNYKDKVVNPTCEDEGYTSHYCDECKYEYRDNFVDAHGHNFVRFVSETLNLESELGEVVYKCDQCERLQTSQISSVNSERVGVTEFVLGQNKFTVSADNGYKSNKFSLKLTNLDVHFNLSLYYTFKADEGLFYNQAYRLNFDSNRVASTYAYDSGEYKIAANQLIDFDYNVDKDELIFNFDYAKHNVSYDEAVGNFAFYLVVNAREKTYEYKDKNPYVLPGYSETWIKVNENNRFYYTTKYQQRHIERLNSEWTRPDITKAEINWTHICRAETPEEAVVSTMIAEENGATNVDVNLLYLKPIYRNYDDMYRIFHAFQNIGTISVYYNGDVSQEERLNLLELSVKAGAGGVDLQGFMFHEGSTKDTHTAENIKYWEDLGYDMSFIEASPKETTIDPVEDAKQIEYIEKIHKLGGKVLGSQHTSAEFTRKQAVAYAKFLDRRGLDIIKVVSHAYSVPALEETILANRDVYYDESIKGKFSIHCNSSSKADISRIIGPLFYHCFMAFNYNYLCKLQMMMDFLNSDVEFDDTISIDEAINRLKGITKDPEFEYLVSEYNKLNRSVGYALGASSNMSDRWSFNGEDSTLVLRSAEGSNSFSIRGAAHSPYNHSNHFEYETIISGYFKPYTSSTRLPKFGIFLGEQEHMLALTYNFETKNGVGSDFSIGLYTNSYKFAYDTKTKDALDTPLMDKIIVDSNVVNGGVIRLKVVYNNGDLSLYYSTSLTGEMTLIDTLEYDEIKNYFTHDADRSVDVGNVVEVYLGTTSVGVQNIVNFKNKYTKK